MHVNAYCVEIEVDRLLTGQLNHPHDTLSNESIPPNTSQLFFGTNTIGTHCQDILALPADNRNPDSFGATGNICNRRARISDTSLAARPGWSDVIDGQGNVWQLPRVRFYDMPGWHQGHISAPIIKSLAHLPCNTCKSVLRRAPGLLGNRPICKFHFILLSFLFLIFLGTSKVRYFQCLTCCRYPFLERECCKAHELA